MANRKAIDETLEEIRLLNTADAAKVLGVSPGTLLRLGADGTIHPPLKIGRNLVRWRVADLRAFVEQQQRPRR